jgi:uncharacterized RDD family membrane protein YckC
MTASEQQHPAGGSYSRPAEAHASAIPYEARAYQGLRAGIVSRLLANTIDAGVLVVVLGALYLAVAAGLFLLRPASFDFPTLPFRGVLLLGGVILVVYLTLSWVATGRTYGDRVLGLRVVNRRGDRLGYTAALLRALACVVFPLGLFWIVVSTANLSLQDLVLRTSVVYDWELRTPPSERQAPPRS